MTGRKMRLLPRDLYDALDACRENEGLSWRALGRLLGCSPSTLTRLGHGVMPELTMFLTMCRWLGAQPWEFVDENVPEEEYEGEL